MSTKKLKKNVDVFAAVERIKKAIADSVNVQSIELSFKANYDPSLNSNKAIYCTVFYEDEGKRKNFSAHLYSSISELSFEELLQEIRAEVEKIKTVPNTGFFVQTEY